MTKQEQIEEMAVIGCVRNPQAHTQEECGKCDFKQGMCNAYRHAENLYNAGYRKIPEDSVVLSKEEQEKILTATESRINKLKEQVKQARKETAKEILSDLLDLHNSVQDINQKTDFYCSIEQLIAEIEIKYDIEVEE